MVIGAMLVAMMLGPISGVALAIIDHRMPLLRKSLITVFLGISLVVLVGFIVGWLHKDQPLTVEILSRTQPTSMDLVLSLAGYGFRLLIGDDVGEVLRHAAVIVPAFMIGIPLFFWLGSRVLNKLKGLHIASWNAISLGYLTSCIAMLWLMGTYS